MNTTWSRREFLELSGAAVGASLATPSLRSGRVPPSDTVRFGMIGVGMQGSGLLGDAITLPGVTCAGAADLYDGLTPWRRRSRVRIFPPRVSIADCWTTRISTASS